MSASVPVAAGDEFSGHPHGENDRHIVQFYEDDVFLVGAVADFLVRGIRQGEPLVVIATPAHRAAVRERLTGGGVDVDRLAEQGGLTMLDAAETLDKFMVDGRPDRRLYREVVGTVLAAVASKSHSGHFCAYGEMVDLLWRGGNRSAAVALEEMWNELRNLRAFSLLCSYVVSSFYKESSGLRDICRTHTHVRPVLDRQHPEQSADNVRALAAEIGHRK